MKLKAIAVVAVVGFSAMTAVEANAGIVNGNFNGSLSGWTVGGTVIWADGQIYNPCCGTPISTTPTFAAFGDGNVTSVNTLSQTFATNPGTTYTLSFESGALGAGSQNLSYALSGGGGGSGTILETADNSLVSTFSPTTVTFTATGASTTLTFTDSSFYPDDIDPVVTNVSLTSAGVPEPSAWAMLILGMAGMGFALRRRRDAVSLA
jgi:hypothetical protein